MDTGVSSVVVCIGVVEGECLADGVCSLVVVGAGVVIFEVAGHVVVGHVGHVVVGHVGHVDFLVVLSTPIVGHAGHVGLDGHVVFGHVVVGHVVVGHVGHVIAGVVVFPHSPCLQG